MNQIRNKSVLGVKFSHQAMSNVGAIETNSLRKLDKIKYDAFFSPRLLSRSFFKRSTGNFFDLDILVTPLL